MPEIVNHDYDPFFLAVQREHLDGDLGSLLVPHEMTYRPGDEAAAAVDIDPL